MKRYIIWIIALTALTIGGWVIREGPQTPAGNPPHKDIYYCPMHPQITSDRPGSCPICGMTLVKKETQGNLAADHPAVPKGHQICLLHNCPMGPDGRSCPMMVTLKEGEIVKCPECGTFIGGKTGNKKILYWTDPMIPGFKADQPGKSPMGMDLVPIFENDEQELAASVGNTPQDYTAIKLSIQKQQLIGIRTAPVIKQNFVKIIHAYGYVAHDLELYEAQLEYIDAWHVFYAYLSRRPIKEEYRQDWREYAMKAPADNRWRSDEKLKAQQRFLKAEYELSHLGVTEPQLKQLREIKYGQPWIQPDLLFFSGDHSRWIYAQIPESDLGFVAAGQKVSVTILAYGEKTEGIVRSVAPVVESQSRTSRVRIELTNYKGELSVNMAVDIDMPVELDASLVVPREAVMDTGLRKIVFVEKKEGQFEPREIETGYQSGGKVAVKSGLEEGERIVVSGNFLLDAESRLQGSLTGGQ